MCEKGLPGWSHVLVRADVQAEAGGAWATGFLQTEGEA